MRFQVLATDYDGTLARHGTVATATVIALERLRAAGLRLLLVTGRELEDLAAIFEQLELAEVVVAENGGVLYYPATREMKALHEPPQAPLVNELRARGITPLSVGHVLVATREPNESSVLTVIKELGLELKIVFNKGAVMVLPPGVNKATGLAAALRLMGLTPESCVGIGDAENDHAFISICGCGVAVANALESLKAEADYVTQSENGAGVGEVIELMLAGQLPAKAPAKDSLISQSQT